MKSIKIEREKLLEIVKANRENHRNIFLEALEGYRREVIRLLEERLEQARKGKRVTHIISLVQPMDQTREYDRVIRMLELTIDNPVELTEMEFAQYVQDEWNWRGAFLHSNAAYSVSAAKLSDAEGDED